MASMGDPALDAQPASLPARVALEGRDVRVVPLDPAAHGDALFEGTAGRKHADLWKYMFDGPFSNRPAFDTAMRRWSESQDPFFYAIVDRASGLAVGRTA